MGFNFSSKRNKRSKRQSKALAFENLEARRLLSVNAGSVGMDTVLVTTTADVVDSTDGVTSLREAVSFANSDSEISTIEFASGAGEAFEGDALIRLTDGQLVITEDLSIDGFTAGGELVITADANGDDITIAGTNITDVSASFGGVDGADDDFLDDNSRVFNVFEASATFVGLTITGGRTTNVPTITFLDSGGNGGGILSQDGDLTLVSTVVRGNSTTSSSAGGGGISFGPAFSFETGFPVEIGTLTLTDSQVIGNSTSGTFATGGGIDVGGDFFRPSVADPSNSPVIQAAGGTVIINNSIISENFSPRDGGGIYIESGDVTINDSTISENLTNGSGGGVEVLGNLISSVTINRTTFSENTSIDGGGGLSVTLSASLEINGSTFSENRNDGRFGGGGLRVSDSSSSAISNSTFVGNFSNSVGGGLALVGRGGFTFDQNTVTGNLAPRYGGVLFGFESPTITNSIVLGNEANVGFSSIDEIDTSRIIDGGGNVFGDVDPSLVFASTASLEGGSVISGVLGDNGGTVQTVALLANQFNPALDVGDAIAGLTTDATGAPRSFDIPGFDNGLNDAGAVELQQAVNILPVASGIPANVTVLEDTASDVDLSGVIFADANGDVLTVTLASSEGALTAASGDNISVLGSGTDTLTLTGSAADINAFLNDASAVQYTSEPNANNANRDLVEIRISANDGTAGTSLGFINVDIIPVNDPASIVGTLVVSIGEDAVAPITGQVSVIDVDPGESAFVAGQQIGALGTFEIDANGQWSYTVDNQAANSLAAGDNALDTFTLTSVDGTEQSFTVEVVGANDAPVFSGDFSGVTNEDATVPFRARLSVTDADSSESLFIASQQDGNFGSFSINLLGAWEYIVDNGSVASLTATQSVTETFEVTTLDGTTTSVSIEVEGRNDHFTDFLTVEAGQSVTFNPLDNDEFSGIVTFTSNLAGNRGDISIGPNGVVTFTPADGFVGRDSFQLTFQDEAGNLGTSNVFVTVNSAQDTNIFGNDDDDTLIGTDGDDNIVGGLGSDLLIGSSGNDVFTTDRINGDHDRFDQDVIDLGNVDGNDTGNDVITDFDVNRANGGENNFDTLDFVFGGIDFSLSTRNDLLDFVDFIETDGDAQTDAIVDGSDLIFVFGRDSDNPDIITSSIRLEDVLNQNGLNSSRLNANSVDILGNSELDIFASGQDVSVGSNQNDALSGDAGNDVLVGGLGSDTLVGGAGNDTLTGDQTDGDNNSADRDTFLLGDVSQISSGNDVITDFDTNNLNGGENNFDTLSLTYAGQSFLLSTGSDFLNFANVLENDGDDDTGTLIDGDDIIFVFSRNSQGIITDSVRLKDIVGDDGLTDDALSVFDELGESNGIDVFDS